jgi:hypothetical protein
MGGFDGMSAPPTERLAWIARCVWRLKRLNASGECVPGWDRPLNWAEYARLLACVLAEYRED